jgi:hypothetical protein
MYFKSKKNKHKKKGCWNSGGNSRQRRKERHGISEEQKKFITNSILNRKRLFIYVE